MPRLYTMKPCKTEREKLRDDVQKKATDIATWIVPFNLVVLGPLLLSLVPDAKPHGLFARVLAALVMTVPLSVSCYFIKQRVRTDLYQTGENLIPDATRKDINELLLLTCHLTGEERRQPREKLLEVLPELKEADTSLLTRQGQYNLATILARRDWELVLASLDALEKVGNTKSLSSVRALAQGKHLAANDPEIREAAAHCLAQIEERLQKGKEGGQLLRPSAPDLAPQTLLRSYESNPSEEPSVLLRGGERPE